MEVKSDELGYLADRISKQSIKGTAWFLLVSYDKNEKDKLKELLSKKELELGRFGKFSAYPYCKIQELIIRPFSKVWLEKYFTKRSWVSIQEYNQMSQQKPERWDYTTETLPFCSKRERSNKMKEICQTFGFYRTGQHEDAERWQPPISQGESPKEKPNLPSV